MNKIKTKALNIIVIAATAITCILCYTTYKPNAYEVYLNGKSVAYVMDKKIAEDINNEAVKQMKLDAGNIQLYDNISYKKIIADEKALSDNKTIKENILSILNSNVKAVEMVIDGKSAGFLRSEKEVEEAISKVAQYYLSNCKLENKKVKGIKNKVVYESKKVHISEVMAPEAAAANIIKLNKKSAEPILSVEITGHKVERLPISYSTSVTWTNSLQQGDSEVKTKGVKGIKQLTKEVTLLNNKEIKNKVVKEAVIQKPTNEVVVKGAKQSSPTELAAMYIPSRGTVSSSFGVRWGRMHKGIDIAAPSGSPINAALDGTVIYAGWSNGYGNLIKIAHDGKIETAYGHCSKIDVKVNDIVKKGDVIGKVGSTGNSTGPHLHFEVKVNGTVKNPAPYIYKK
jgi:murein DD-endopeptidase MepM/ murein hydrolase activator NlpD